MNGEFNLADGAVTKYYAIAGMTVARSDGSGMKFLLTDHASTSSAQV